MKGEAQVALKFLNRQNWVNIRLDRSYNAIGFYRKWGASQARPKNLCRVEQAKWRREKTLQNYGIFRLEEVCFVRTRRVVYRILNKKSI